MPPVRKQNHTHPGWGARTSILRETRRNAQECATSKLALRVSMPSDHPSMNIPDQRPAADVLTGIRSIRKTPIGVVVGNATWADFVNRYSEQRAGLLCCLPE